LFHDCPEETAVIYNIIAWCVFGLIAGAIARFLVPGRDPLGCLGTIILGVVGSLIGGFLAGLLFRAPGDQFQPAGMIGAVIGGIIALLVYRRFARPRL
jgi:uncharacterized membrane protein YeaQ/YmgE (transglycosylase-associated protein family)